MIAPMMKSPRTFFGCVVVRAFVALGVILHAGCAPSRKGQDVPRLSSPAVTVPDLKGMTPEAAAATLAEGSLVLGKTFYTADSRWADISKPGLVVGQSETPRARVPRKTVVNIVVYLPTPREYGEVPDVQGMKYDEAVAALEKAGFLVGEITSRHVKDQRLYDIVYRQSPEPRTLARRWSKVNLGLYGPVEERFARVPRLTGLNAAEVPAVLAKHGLKQGTVTYEPAPSASLVGSVRAQSPGVGVKVKPGTKVDITVYSK